MTFAVVGKDGACAPLQLGCKLDVGGTLAQRRGEIETQRIEKGFLQCRQPRSAKPSASAASPGPCPVHTWSNALGARWPVISIAVETQLTYEWEDAVSRKDPEVCQACNELFNEGIGLGKLRELIPPLKQRGFTELPSVRTLGDYRRNWRRRKAEQAG